MTLNSKYFDSIRIRPKKTTEAKSSALLPVGWLRQAGHASCAGRAYARGEYLHFCIDHVREYNKNFNYFSGLSDGDIAKFQKDAITGHRPTWSTAANSTTRCAPRQIWPRCAPARPPITTVSATLSISSRRPRGTPGQKAQRKPRTLELKALATLGLDANSTGDKIKARYKELVKASPSRCKWWRPWVRGAIP